MKKGKGRKILIAAAAVLVLLVMTAGGLWLYAKFAPERAAETYAAAADRLLFTKTVHDFSGHLVDNLDESESENFVVYAKGVRRVEPHDGANHLAQVDSETGICIIEQPDEQVTGLKPGDVFFMDASEQCVSGFALKVEEITVDNGRATIQGVAPELRELLEYVDVDMDLSMQTVFVEDNGQVYTAGWEEPVDEQALWDSQSRQEFTAGLEQLSYPSVEALMGQRVPSQPSAGTETEQFSGEQDTSPEPVGAPSQIAGKGQAVEKPVGSVNESISSQFHLSVALERVFGPVAASGEIGTRISNIRVTYKFHPWLLNVETGVRMDARNYFDGKLGLQLSGEWELGMPTVYFPMAGPLGTFWSFTPTLELTGGVYGHLGVAWDTSIDVQSTQFLTSPIPHFRYHETHPQNVAFRVDFTDVEGKVQLNLLRAMGGVGVPTIAEMRLQCGAGVVANANLELDPGVQEDGTMHICDACVDGDVDWVAELKAGTTWSYGAISDSWYLTLLNLRGDFPVEKYREFYVSFQKEKDPKVECDWGPCPYKGVLYTVQVTSPIQNEEIPLSNFVVRAEDEDGKVTWELTDEKGIAQLILQQGRYQLSVEHGFFEHTEQLTISEDEFSGMTTFDKDAKRIDKTVEADLEPEVFVILCHDKGGGKGSGSPTNLLSRIMGSTRYTKLVVDHSMSDYEMKDLLLANGAVPGDIVVNIWYHEADKSTVRGEGWVNNAFILGFFNADFGRLLYEYSGVDDNGEEQNPDVGLYWWEKSYNNFYGNGTYINGFSFHDDLNSSDDIPPEFNGMEQHCQIILNLTDGPRYDAAYAAIPVNQILQEQNWYREPLGNLSFGGMLSQIPSLRSRLVGRGSLYSQYAPAMLDHQDFKLLFP